MFKKFSIAISLATLLLSCNDQHAGNHSTGDKKETDQPIVITHTKKDYTDTVKKSLPAIAKGNINGNR